MPVTPPDAEALVYEVADVYADAEATMLGIVAKRVMSGTEANGWEATKLAEVRAVRRELRAALVKHGSRTARLLSRLLGRAYRIGAKAAGRDVPTATARRAEAALARVGEIIPDSHAIAALTAELTHQVTSTRMRMLSASEGIYRQVVAKAVQQTLTGTVSRRDAAQQALTTLAGRGITGYTDSRGRNWDLTTYIEQATRTAVGRALAEGAMDQYRAAGYDLVSVSNSPQECNLCREWEGQILSITGAPAPPGTYVKGTLADALRAGLFHPNCEHRVLLYIPGVTPLPETPTADPQGYKDRQRLRYLERQTRLAHKQLLVAVTPRAQAVGKAKVRARHAQIRHHVATTSARRRPHRERLGTAR